jgi:GntR family transcriptional regulator, phosphonate transport system regulatory protein
MAPSKDKKDRKDDASLTPYPGKAPPRWRQIQHSLEQEIREGVYAPGDRLPTETALAKRFKVHRHTVRRAVGRLRERDLVRVEKGSGIFVREAALVYTLSRHSRLTTAALGLMRTPLRRVLSSTRVKADRKTALALSVPVGRMLLRVDMLRLVDDRPVAVTTYFFPLPRFETIHELIEQTGSISEAFRQLGVMQFGRKSLQVKATLPTAVDARKLNITRSKPLIELSGVNVDQDGVPIQFTYSRLISAWIDLVLEFKD